MGKEEFITADWDGFFSSAKTMHPEWLLVLHALVGCRMVWNVLLGPTESDREWLFLAQVRSAFTTNLDGAAWIQLRIES